MAPRRSAKLTLALIATGALLLAGSALLLSFDGFALPGPLQDVVLLAFGILLGWSLLAWSARRLLVPGPLKSRLYSIPAMAWFGLRMALLLATLAVILGWASAAAIGSGVTPALARAFVPLVLLSTALSMIDGAVRNTLLTVRRARVAR